ncbi:unnamed protein product [Adineta ricciae]|uniref:Uncharacterized protein n=1 Tax=Adineta ricciae TaxID=249248 RepID=A0A815QNS4_ADIRI|nr:unnamed protein product [Adineta ricciae]
MTATSKFPSLLKSPLTNTSGALIAPVESVICGKNVPSPNIVHCLVLPQQGVRPAERQYGSAADRPAEILKYYLTPSSDQLIHVNAMVVLLRSDVNVKRMVENVIPNAILAMD